MSLFLRQSVVLFLIGAVSNINRALAERTVAKRLCAHIERSRSPNPPCLVFAADTLLEDTLKTRHFSIIKHKAHVTSWRRRCFSCRPVPTDLIHCMPYCDNAAYHVSAAFQPPIQRDVLWRLELARHPDSPENGNLWMRCKSIRFDGCLNGVLMAAGHVCCQGGFC